MSMLTVVVASVFAEQRLFLPLSPASRHTSPAFALDAGGAPRGADSADPAWAGLPDGWILLACAAGGLALSAAARPAFALFGVAGGEDDSISRGGEPRMSEVSMEKVPERGWTMEDITPDGSLAQRIEGKTRKTWKFNDVSKDRVQVALTSSGRPVNVESQLWLGPDWTPMKLKAYSEDGNLRPVQTLIGTRNKQAMIEVKNVGEYEFPIKAASNYAQGTMAQIPQELIATTTGVRVDGGALRSFPVDASTKQL